MATFLLIKKMKIKEANAMPCSYIVGFPSITAWLGCIYALERFANTEGFDISFPAVSVVSHGFKLRAYKDSDSKYKIAGSALPLQSDGGRPSMIEEAKCDICVSLLVQCEGITIENKDNVVDFVKSRIKRMRFAGGELANNPYVEICTIDESASDQEKSLLRKLVPGYALISRRDLLMDESQPLSVLLDYLETNNHFEDGRWKQSKKMNGWIVPISVGFKDLTGIVAVKNSRAPDVEHHFAEPLVTLGEFVMPHRFDHVEDILWHYEYNEKNGIYACVNSKGAN